MDRFITLSGLKIHYTVSGEGPAIILMHGWGCNTTTLASIERVAVETNTVYNIDFPGFGESEEPHEVWGVERYTQLLRAFVEALAIDKPSLLGHSFGGRVAIVYASLYPVDKVILVDAAGVKPKRSMKYYFKVYSFKAMKRLAPLFMGREAAARLIEARRSKSGSSDYNNSTPMMRSILSKVVNEDLKHFMPKIQSPTLLVWGEKDTATPLSDAKVMERLIPGAGLVVFDGCGHYSFLDRPGQFAAVLRSFLRS